MKHLTTAILFLFLSGICYGQKKSPDYTKAIQVQADSMGHFFLKKNFDPYIAFTYPKLVEMAGGKEKMIEVLETGVKEMEAEGAGFLSLTFGTPSAVIAANNQLQCTIPQMLVMKVPGGRLTAQSTLIAISTDNGKSWYFVDTSGKDIETMKKILPELSADLVIPKPQEPVFQKD